MSNDITSDDQQNSGEPAQRLAQRINGVKAWPSKWPRPAPPNYPPPQRPLPSPPDKPASKPWVAVDDGIKQFVPELKKALAIKTDCTAVTTAQADLQDGFNELKSARQDSDLEGTRQWLDIANTRLFLVTDLEFKWQELLKVDDDPQIKAMKALQGGQSQTQDKSKSASLTALDEALDAGKKGDFKTATSKAGVAVNYARQANVQIDKERYETKYEPIDIERTRILNKHRNKKGFGDPPGSPVDGYLKTFVDEDTKRFQATMKRDFVTACAHVAELKKVIPKVVEWEAGEAKRLIGLIQSGKKKKQVLEQVQAQLEKDENLLKCIAEQEGGHEFIDKLVKSFDGKAKDEAGQKFVQKAINARFNVHFESKDGGDTKLTKKAPLRLYDVMLKVPRSHTTDNERLKKISRCRDSGDDASWYKGDDNSIELNLGRTGTWGGMISNKDTLRPDGKWVGSIVNEFDCTTLHEVGHAVDANDKDFMGRHGHLADYGGWNQETRESIVAAAGEQLGFFSDFNQYPRYVLDLYLGALLDGADPESIQKRFETAVQIDEDDIVRQLSADPGIDEAEKVRAARKGDKTSKKDLAKKKKECAKLLQLSDPGLKDAAPKLIDKIIDSDDAAAKTKEISTFAKSFVESFKVLVKDIPSQQDLTAMAKQKAVPFLQNVRMTSGSSGLWDQGKSGATQAAIGDRVYQEAYKNDYWSYDINARKKGVSQYQFRAPGEWFAEAYAAYFLKKLKKNHALYGWLEEEVKKDKVAKKAVK
jgi:hypothetical protein